MKKSVMVCLAICGLSCSCMPGLDPPLDSLRGEDAAEAVDTGGTEGASNVTAAGGTVSGEGEGGGEGADAIVRPAWIVINEVLYDIVGSDTDGDSFIELAGEAGANIGGYKLALVNGADGNIYATITIPQGMTIPGDGVFVIADAVTGSPGTTRVENADYVINFDPQNGPDAVQLLDDAGNLLDVVGYGLPIVSPAANGLASYEGSPAEDVRSGVSITRIDAVDTDDNAHDFVPNDIPTPGIVDMMAL